MQSAIVAAPARAVATTSPPLGRFLESVTDSVVIERRSLALEFRSAGKLVPWLGPAVRGITALRYRAAVCRQPMADWKSLWKHCRGCPHGESCGYGIAFEPEAFADAAHSAIIDAVRRVVIAPAFPTPVAGHRGMSLPVLVTGIGSAANATLPGIVAALASAGRGDGLGPDRVRFTVVEGEARPETVVVNPAHLPPLVAGPTIPSLTIRLTGPLFLRARESRTRHVVLRPDFATLARHAVRIVHECVPGTRGRSTAAGEGLAAPVATVADSFVPYRQEKASRRTFQRFEMEGVVGECTFADVPACFLPWLTLAGMLHVGGHRVAGAGGWTVETAVGPKGGTGRPR